MDVPLFKIYWDSQDIEKVTSVINRGMYWALGVELEEFEDRVAKYLGVKYALATNSGTSALHTILLAYGIGPGDEVIVPSFTFIATANSPLFVGAKPVFADIEEETYGLDPIDVERKITPDTKAIIPVHVGGLPCKINELTKIARKYNLIIIEDNAESFGASIDSQKTGSFGDSAILSFCAPKIITTGEGGMILTNTKAIHGKAKLISNHGRVESSNYLSYTTPVEYVELGYNFRMSTMAAALGLAQLEKVNKIINLRVENSRYLTSSLSSISSIKCPNQLAGYHSVYQMYTIRVDNRTNRDGLRNYLSRKGIKSWVYFEPVHLSKFYLNNFDTKDLELPMTNKVSGEVLSLPMYPSLTVAEIDYIASSIKEFFASRLNHD